MKKNKNLETQQITGHVIKSREMWLLCNMAHSSQMPLCIRESEIIELGYAKQSRGRKKKKKKVLEFEQENTYKIPLDQQHDT